MKVTFKTVYVVTINGVPAGGMWSRGSQGKGGAAKSYPLEYKKNQFKDKKEAELLVPKLWSWLYQIRQTDIIKWKKKTKPKKEKFNSQQLG